MRLFAIVETYLLEKRRVSAKQGIYAHITQRNRHDNLWSHCYTIWPELPRMSQDTGMLIPRVSCQNLESLLDGPAAISSLLTCLNVESFRWGPCIGVHLRMDVS